MITNVFIANDVLSSRLEPQYHPQMDVEAVQENQDQDLDAEPVWKATISSQTTIPAFSLCSTNSAIIWLHVTCNESQIRHIGKFEYLLHASVLLLASFPPSSSVLSVLTNVTKHIHYYAM